METFSDGQISDPTRAQYRTVPLRPHNVTFAPQSIGPTSFSVRWSGPIGISEFDRYQVRTGGHSVRVVARTGMMRILFQVAIGIRRKTPQIIERGQPLVARFTENLTPGRGFLFDCENQLMVCSSNNKITNVSACRPHVPGGGEDSVRVGGLVAGHG